MEEESETMGEQSEMIEKGGEYNYELKIPKERIAVLIGTKGETKKDIEEITNSRIKVDSKEGEVILSGTDSLGLFTAREVIHAIARGFNPDIAKSLLKQDYSFEIINLNDYAGKSKNNMVRFKGRIIGSEGKARKTIEDLTECNISVYGKTVGIIGEMDQVAIARRAVEMLLSGAPHSTVYKYLEKNKKLSQMQM